MIGSRFKNICMKIFLFFTAFALLFTFNAGFLKETGFIAYARTISVGGIYENLYYSEVDSDDDGIYEYVGITGHSDDITDVVIPDKLEALPVTSIGYGAFYHCSSLTSITIPESVTSIGGCAFYCCSNLTDVYYSGTEKEWKKIDIDLDNDALFNANIHYKGSETTEKNNKEGIDTVAELRVSNVCASPGEIVSVDVIVSGGSVASTAVSYVFDDEALEFVGVKAGKLSPQKTYQPAKVSVTTASTENANGVIYSLLFTVLDSATTGTVYPITITNVGAFNDNTGTRIPYTVSSGSVYVADSISKIIVSDVEGAVGETVSVDVKVEGQGVESTGITYVFDEALESVGVKSGSLSANRVYRAGKTSITTTSPSHNNANGVIYSLLFKIPESAENGKVYPITVKNVGSFADNTGTKLGYTVKSGSVRVHNHPNVIIDNIKAKPGETVSVDVKVEGQGVASTGFTYRFDEGLMCTGIKAGSLHPQKVLGIGSAAVTTASTENANGVIYSLLFTVPKSASVGTIYPIYVTTISSFADNNGTPVPCLVSDGCIEVIENVNEVEKCYNYDEENNILTLKDNVIKEQIRDFIDNEYESYSNSLLYVDAEPGTVFPSDCSNLFGGLGFQTRLRIDISNVDTSKVTDMSYMFDFCQGLEYLDISNFDTSNVTNMEAMFRYSVSLDALDVSSFNTAKVKYMAAMFDGLNAETLDLSNFDTSNVIDMSEMFSCCQNLTTLNLENFDTSSVEYMCNIFGECVKLSKIIIGKNFRQVDEQMYLSNGNGWANINEPSVSISGNGEYAEIQNSGTTTYVKIVSVTLWADPTLDNSNSVADLILINKYFVGGAELSKQAIANCDLNGNGVLDSMDCIYMLQLLVGKISLNDLPIITA